MNLSQLVTNYEPPSPRRSSYSSQQSQRSWRAVSTCQPAQTPSPYTSILELPATPEDEPATRYSLPPISTLFQGIDSISPPQSAKRQRSDDWEEERYERKYRMILPPTPPQRPGSSFEQARRSPSASSAASASTMQVPGLTGSSTLTSPASDAPTERPMSRVSYSNRSSFSEARYPSPANSNVARFTSPTEQRQASSPEFYPAAAPAFKPVPVAQPQPQQPSQHHHHQMVSMGDMANTAWQHHHYFPPSNTAAYPLNHDRYICRTCNKAFSRPSSLRIHSHSHTGEKPFRCPRPGCGKAFSVRSNMKRHERGCHSGRATQRVTHVG